MVITEEESKPMGTQTGRFIEGQRNEGVRVPHGVSKYANTVMDN